MDLQLNFISRLKNVCLFIPFIFCLVYPFLNVPIYFIFNLAIFISFFIIVYNSMYSKRFILPIYFSYFFYTLFVYLISYAFSPVRDIISAEYINLVSGFLIFLIVLNTENINIKMYYPWFIAILILFVIDSFYDIGISSKGNLNLFAFIFLIFFGILLKEKKYYYGIVFFAAILFTKSQAAILSILFSSILYAYDNRKNIDVKNNKIMIIILIILGIFLVANIELKSIFDRLSWWYSAIKMFLERPFTGWGYSSFTHVVSAFSSLELKTIYPHNYFLGILAEGGIFALVFWILFLFKTVKVSRLPDRYILISLLVHSIFDIGPDTVCGWWLFMFYLALVLKNNSYIFIFTNNYVKIVKVAISLFIILILKYFQFSYSLFYVEHTIKNSINFISNSNYNAAIDLAEDALKKYPSNIDLASNRAFVYLQASKYDPVFMSDYLKSLEYILLINPYRKDIYNILIGNYQNIDQKLVLDVSKRMRLYIKN